MITWLWHRFVLRHKMTHHPAIQPTYRTVSGINVYEQTKFAIPIAHWECSCGNGEIWEDRDLEYVLMPLGLLVGCGVLTFAGIAFAHWRNGR